MKLLLTGARGFIGSHCLPLLQQRGIDVHAITPHAAPAHGSPVMWHTVDLLDARAVERTVHAIKPTHLLHLAWITTPGIYWTSDENTRWLTASKHLLDVFAQADGHRAVLAGTCAEYDWSHGVCHETSTPLAPQTLYGQSKLALWQHAQSLRSLSSSCGRVFFAYGPGEPLGRFIPSTIIHLLRGENAPCSTGYQWRDYIDVTDVAAAFVALLTSDVTGPVNIGRGAAVSIAEIAQTIGRLTGRPELIQLGALPTAEQAPLVVADTHRLRDEVGFTPHVELVPGLRRFVAAIAQREASRAIG
jgi:nucleoside-diphosphate-sugar epimerase